MKSGTDFRNYCLVTLRFGEAGSPVRVTVEECSVTKRIAEDKDMKAICDQFSGGGSLLSSVNSSVEVGHFCHL